MAATRHHLNAMISNTVISLFTKFIHLKDFENLSRLIWPSLLSLSGSYHLYLLIDFYVLQKAACTEPIQFGADTLRIFRNNVNPLRLNVHIGGQPQSRLENLMRNPIRFYLVKPGSHLTSEGDINRSDLVRYRVGSIVCCYTIPLCSLIPLCFVVFLKNMST